MDSKADRKEAIRKFKERKSLAGAFAVRCTATGRTWVGSSRNLEATKNGLWFSLRLGNHQEKSLQEEWNAHGENVFQYEIVEKLAEDVSPIEVYDLLKEKRRHWVAHLSADPL